MSLETFIDDLRNLPVIKPFEKGNDKQRVHLNELVNAVGAVKNAADREAAAQDEGGDGVQVSWSDNGIRVVYRVVATLEE